MLILLFTIWQNGLFAILEKKKKLIEKLENIVINELLKNVINMKNLKKTVKNYHYIVLLTEFCLFQAQNKFWLCEYPLYSYKSDKSFEL